MNRYIRSTDTRRFSQVAIAIAAITLTFLFATPSFAGGPSGRWTGSWTSQSSGHHGALRARIRQVDSDTYRAIFAGRFAVVVPFVYPAKLERVPGTCNCYRSNTRLPLMGDYRMTAHISSGQFSAVYNSKNDRGIFRMTQR
ncbi:hypothetical protein LOC67_21865 [Stieleria sp. JC731]|uniref:hypothetical protein n=1 Tax=Pirellulaceae TaxID=2691357 RepID=UPI001E464804|nr:hypothetical protein [Stieleria sp. JC731]MCC9603204.1 hypothetical protein [Stieleria sp. JC731]